MAYVYSHTRTDTNEVFYIGKGCNYFNLSYKTQTFALKGKYSTAQFYFENEYFERPTKQSISKKLGKLRIGNQNWKGKLKTEKNGNLQR